MNIEELKLILDTVRGVSGDIQVFAIWWLLLTELVPPLAWLTGFWMVFRWLHRWVEALNTESLNEQVLKELRDHLGIGSCGDLSARERQAILATVRRLHQQEEQRRREAESAAREARVKSCTEGFKS